MLTYDGSRLTEESVRRSLWNALFPSGPVLSTWVRRAPASGFFRFFVKGRGIRLRSVEIYFRKPAGEKDVLTRANDSALDGRTDTALELFGELFKLAATPLDQCGFLYRQALVHRSAGEALEAVNSYQRILADYPENLYSGYARLDLGVMEMEAAEKASHSKDRDHHAAKARGYLGGLLKRQKDNPEAPRASYLLSVAALLEHDREKAAKEALALIPSGSPYAEPAFSVWLKALKGFGKKVDPAWPEQAIPELEALFHQKKLKGPLREKAAVALAEALRLMGKAPELSALVTQACEPGAYSLPGREAIVAQWIAAEDKGLPLETSQELFGRFGKNSEEGLIFARAYLRGAGTKLADPVQAALWKAVKLDTKTPGPQDLKRREFMDWARGRFKIQGGAEGASVSPREEGGIIFKYRSGSETEQHLVIGPGVGPFSYEGGEDLPGQAVDVRLYKKVTFKAKCPKRKHFSLCLAELGTGDPAIRYAKGPGGSDGEEYEVGSWTGTGQWQHYELRLKDAKTDLDWGNQEGDLKVALGALGAVVLVVPTGEGSGELEFKDLVFER
jgi:tetratricopeptide (TPR) repeat protein